jgi:hypothetical protein
LVIYLTCTMMHGITNLKMNVTVSCSKQIHTNVYKQDTRS